MESYEFLAFFGWTNKLAPAEMEQKWYCTPRKINGWKPRIPRWKRKILWTKPSIFRCNMLIFGGVPTIWLTSGCVKAGFQFQPWVPAHHYCSIMQGQRLARGSVYGRRIPWRRCHVGDVKWFRMWPMAGKDSAWACSCWTAPYILWIAEILFFFCLGVPGLGWGGGLRVRVRRFIER